MDDLREAAALQHGATHIDARRLDLADVLRAAVELFRSQASRRGLEMSIQSHDDHVWIAGDTGRLRQALSSLLNNAVRYATPGGEIEQREHRLRLRVAVLRILPRSVLGEPPVTDGAEVRTRRRSLSSGIETHDRGSHGYNSNDGADGDPSDIHL